MLTRVTQVVFITFLLVVMGVFIHDHWPTGSEETGGVFLFEQFQPEDNIVIIRNPADDNRTAWVLNERTSTVTALACADLQYGSLNPDGNFQSFTGTQCREEVEFGQVYFSYCSSLGYKVRGASLGAQDNLADSTPTGEICKERERELATEVAEFEQRITQ